MVPTGSGVHVSLEDWTYASKVLLIDRVEEGHVARNQRIDSSSICIEI